MKLPDLKRLKLQAAILQLHIEALEDLQKSNQNEKLVVDIYD